MAGAISRKAQHSLNTVVITQLNLLRKLEHLGVQLVLQGKLGVQLSALTLQPSIVEKI